MAILQAMLAVCRGINMRILVYCWKAYNQADIITAFRRRGHIVDTFEVELGNFEKDDSFERIFVEKLSGNNKAVPVYDAVFSVNYFPIISDLCGQFAGLKYICWTCDSPLSTMYHQSIFNEWNYIFIFDRFCYMTFKELGANVYYLPLAAAVGRAESVIAEAEKEHGKCRAEKSYEDSHQNSGSREAREERRYRYDVSFVGSMYRKNSYDEVRDKLPDYVRGYFDALMKLQMEIYGENYIDGMLTADIIEELNRHFKIEKSERSFSDISLIFSTTVLGFKIAQLERYKLLGELSKYFDVNVFTDDENAEFILAHNRGPVRYWDESPVVFAGSKINLNFTIRNIRSGIPLRVWDILAAGGFCITNFQPELAMYFKNGEDLVWFEDEADLIKKVRYYLTHEDERKKIALNGQKKVRELHNYDVRLDCIEKITGC